MKENPIQSWILDVVLAWIPVFAVELEFSILIVSYSSTPDSLSCITDSKAQDSGFHNEKSLRFQNPFSLSFFLFFLYKFNLY